MSNTVKLIIEIPKAEYECAKQRWMSEKDAHKMDYYMPQWMKETDAHKMDYYISNGIPLDDVKAEFINSYPTNWAGEPELGGASCEFSLCKVLEILDNIGKESED